MPIGVLYACIVNWNGNIMVNALLTGKNTFSMQSLAHPDPTLLDSAIEILIKFTGTLALVPNVGKSFPVLARCPLTV